MKTNKNAAMETQFRTPVSMPIPLRKMGVGDRSAFLGSCFAEHIGQRFTDAHLLTLCNPLGTAYNPLSIKQMLEAKPIEEDDVTEGPMGFHSWLTDTTFSAHTKDEAINKTNDNIKRLQLELLTCDNLFITLGSSHAYRLKRTGKVVTNCHKHPQSEFEEIELSVDEIVESLDSSLSEIKTRNSKMIVTFTVSPYRYAKYGFHESQLSKARLLLAVEELQRRHPEWIQYFPAYEIVMDELRDYRFYDADMLHPSVQAIDYVWQRLQEWMDGDLQTYLSRWQPLSRALSHRPLCAEGKEYREFCSQTNEKLEQLQQDYPMLPIDVRL